MSSENAIQECCEWEMFSLSAQRMILLIPLQPLNTLTELHNLAELISHYQHSSFSFLHCKDHCQVQASRQLGSNKTKAISACLRYRLL